MSPINWDEFFKGMEDAAPQAAEDIGSVIMGWYDDQANEIENAEAIQAKAVQAGMKCVKLAGVNPNIKRNDGGKVVPCTCNGRGLMCGCNRNGGWLIPKGYTMTMCGVCRGNGQPPLFSGLFYCPSCNGAGSVAVKSK